MNLLKRDEHGFGAVEGILIVIIVALIGVGGWLVYKKHHSDTPTNDSTVTANQTIQQQQQTTPIPDGWGWYENQDMGLKIAHPEDWKIGVPTPVSALNGHDGISVSLTPPNAQNGDPLLGVSSFPAEANIKDVDADSSATELLTLTTADKLKLTFVGVIDQPSAATKPTSAGITSCWPRMCEPKLKNGRSLSMYMGAINHQCEPHVACFIELNTASKNYSTAIDIMKTVTSL